ncbi:Kinesin light chain [Lasiodiplodia theobromae]|uniref:Kinesin light chain n=1 Tax=Lasiodiplodia theobromae TaxID=45133 RepID=UPI0015C3D33A|nr:Kinesin light chain [Lasiodiplodia theobromae]KAF4536072.1 Kinesin light chain [Lasiodiplodia theobromae]
MEEAAMHLTHAHDTISKRPNSFPAFDILSIKGNLANVLLELGEHEKALELQKQLVIESTGRSNHLATRNDLAFIYQKLNRLELAEQEYCRIDEELENRCTATSSNADPFHMIIKSNKASLYVERGKYAEAEKLQRQVKNILKRDKSYGELNRETITSRFNLALILKKRGKDPKAEKQLNKALENMEKLVGKDHIESKAMDAKLQEWKKGSDERTMGAQVRNTPNRGPRRDSGCATSDQTL